MSSSAQKSHVGQPPSHGNGADGWGPFQKEKILFARNWIKFLRSIQSFIFSYPPLMQVQLQKYFVKKCKAPQSHGKHGISVQIWTFHAIPSKNFLGNFTPTPTFMGRKV